MFVLKETASLRNKNNPFSWVKARKGLLELNNYDKGGKSMVYGANGVGLVAHGVGVQDSICIWPHLLLCVLLIRYQLVWGMVLPLQCAIEMTKILL